MKENTTVFSSRSANTQLKQSTNRWLGGHIWTLGCYLRAMDLIFCSKKKNNNVEREAVFNTNVIIIINNWPWSETLSAD